MTNRIGEADNRPNSPFSGSITITPADGADLPTICHGIYVGGTGDLKVTMLDGSTPTYKAVPVGTLLPIQVSRVFATGTTATLLIGLIRV